MCLLNSQAKNGGINVKNFQQFKQMFLAQLKLTLREKQAWFWGIFFPVILMVIFMVIFTGDSEDEFHSKVAIVDQNPNATSELMLTQLQQIPVLKVESNQPVNLEKAQEFSQRKRSRCGNYPARFGR